MFHARGVEMENFPINDVSWMDEWAGGDGASESLDVNNTHRDAIHHKLAS